MVKVRDGNDDTVHYFITSEELEEFKLANGDLFNGDTEMRARRTARRGARKFPICISKARPSRICSANFPRKVSPWIIMPRRTSRCLN